jgi:hypothetical protein
VVRAFDPLLAPAWCLVWGKKACPQKVSTDVRAQLIASVS